MEKKNPVIAALTGMPAFFKNQDRDWKITVIRTSLERLGYQIIYPYLSLYIVALGAEKSQLGLITAVGMLLAGFLGPFTGKFIDKNGAKKAYICGISLLLLSYLLYAFAPSWQVCVAAMIVYYLGQGTSSHSCGTICGNCLKNCDRARGMLICESLAAGLLGMVGPMLSAFVLVNVIGVEESAATASDYHYLFFFSAFFTTVSLLVVLFKLSNRRWAVKNTSDNAIKEGIGILKKYKNARKWLVINAVANLPTAMILPYVQVFAKENKMASVTVLAAMVTVSAMVSTFLGYPIGALADRFGRKKVLYVLIPLFWLSNIMLVVSPSPVFLIITGVLQGFYHVTSPLSGAIQRELVPNEVMGTWLGVTRLTNSIVSAAGALLGGIVYQYLGPQFVFLGFIAIDAIFRMPLLISLPETLHKEAD